MRKRLGVLLLLLLGLVLADPAWSATKYVSNAGNDTTGDGSIGNPWANPQKCVGNVGPDDTCLVVAGTYTDTDGNGIVLYITASTGAIDGTLGHPVTFRSETPGGAKLRMPAATSTNSYGVRVTRPYYVIDGFEITDDDLPSTQGASAGSTGISFGESAGATGALITHNNIHNISRNVCSDSPIGNSGIGGKPGVGAVVKYNIIRTIGRKRNAEAGCTTTLYQNDHGIYVWAVSNFSVVDNLFYDNGRGYDIQNYAASQVSTGFYIYNNTFVKPTLSGSAPTACMILTYTNTDVQIKNNIFYNCPSGYALTWFAPGTQTNVVLSFNLTDSADADLNNPGSKPASGVTTNNNIISSTTINFANIGANDYTLTSGSAAIDAGTNVGLPFNGASSPTIGVFDPPRFSVCEVPSGAGTKIRVTYTNNVAPPMLPASGATTYTARKNAVSDAITATGKVSSNVVELTVTAAYVGGNTADISWSAGNVSDSMLIGGSLNQKPVTNLTNQSCTNNVGGVSFTLTQVLHELHQWNGTEAAPLMLPHGVASTGAAENYVGYSFIVGSKFRIRLDIVCGVANCDPTGFALYYALNGGGYAAVPNTFGADQVAFCGPLTDVPQNASATTNQTSTAGTFIPGGFLVSADTIPLISGLLTGYKTSMEYCVNTSSSVSGFIDFRAYQSDGTALSAYTVTPRVTFVPFAAGY